MKESFCCLKQMQKGIKRAIMEIVKQIGGYIMEKIIYVKDIKHLLISETIFQKWNDEEQKHDIIEESFDCSNDELKEKVLEMEVVDISSYLKDGISYIVVTVED